MPTPIVRSARIQGLSERGSVADGEPPPHLMSRFTSAAVRGVPWATLRVVSGQQQAVPEDRQPDYRQGGADTDRDPAGGARHDENQEDGQGHAEAGQQEAARAVAQRLGTY